MSLDDEASRAATRENGETPQKKNRPSRKVSPFAAGILAVSAIFAQLGHRSAGSSADAPDESSKPGSAASSVPGTDNQVPNESAPRPELPQDLKDSINYNPDRIIDSLVNGYAFPELSAAQHAELIREVFDTVVADKDSHSILQLYTVSKDIVPGAREHLRAAIETLMREGNYSELLLYRDVITDAFPGESTSIMQRAVAGMQAKGDASEIFGNYPQYKNVVPDARQIAEGAVDQLRATGEHVNMLASSEILVEILKDNPEKLNAILTEIEEALATKNPDLLLREGRKVLVAQFGQQHYDDLVLRIVNATPNTKQGFESLYSMREYWHTVSGRLDRNKLKAFGVWMTTYHPIELDMERDLLDGMDETTRAPLFAKAHSKAGREVRRYIGDWKEKGSWQQFLYLFDSWSPYVDQGQRDSLVKTAVAKLQASGVFGRVVGNVHSQKALRASYGEDDARTMVQKAGAEWHLSQ